MRFIALKNVLVLCAMWLLAAQIAAADSVPMVDPLLGLHYDPAIVHFDELPPSTSSKRLLGKTVQWIYADHRDKKSTAIEYYIVAGYETAADEAGDPGVVEPGFGAVVQVRHRRARVLGVPDRLFGKYPILRAELVNSLMCSAALHSRIWWSGPAECGHEGSES